MDNNNNKDHIKPISYVKNHTADVIMYVNESKRPLYVTQNGEAKGVVLDVESYESMRQSLGLLKALAQGENDIAQKRYTDNKTVLSAIENRFFPDESP